MVCVNIQTGKSYNNEDVFNLIDFNKLSLQIEKKTTKNHVFFLGPILNLLLKL